MSAASSQLQLPPGARLPIDPTDLVDVEPIDRGRAYNVIDLDSWQRACVEEARRMVIAGTYPEAPK
jgi:hypothetical protein